MLLLFDKVLVEPIPSETITSSGLIIPETIKSKVVKGKVLNVGKGKINEPMTVKVGDIVMFDKHSGYNQ